MFENIETIEWLEPDENKQALYYFQHPSEYEGDFIAFRDKLIAYGERLSSGKALADQYDIILQKRRDQTKRGT